MRVSAKTILLTTASSIALTALASMPNKASAEEPVLILEGQAGWLSGDDQVWAVRVPPVPFQTRTVSPERTYEGTIGVITPAQDLVPSSPAEWSIGMFARFGASNEETKGGLGYYYYNVLGGNYSTYYSVGRVEHQETHAFVDFEARRDVGLGAGQEGSLTTFIGASFGYLNAQTDTDFVFLPNPALYTLNERRETQFIGAGPRVGFERRIPVGANVSLDLAGSASILFGRRNTSTVTNGGLPFVGNQIHQSDLDFVSLFAGRIGFTFSAPGSPATLGVGVEGRAWINAFDQSTNLLGAPQLGETNADRFSVNPYVRLTIPLGGGGGALAFAPDKELAAEAIELEERFGSINTVTELELRGGYVNRSGNAINQFGPITEDDGFGIAGVGLLMSSPIADNWIVQFEADGEASTGSGGVSDNFESGYTVAAQAAFTDGQLLLGLLGGAGGVDVESGGTVNQDADLWFYGAQGRLLGMYGALYAQAGLFDTSAANPETISNGHFAKVGGQWFGLGPGTIVSADVTYLGGEQDPDDIFGPDSVDLLSWGVEIEGDIPGDFNGNQVSYFASYRNIRIDEHNTALADDSISDDLFEGGIRIRLGNSDLMNRQKSAAPKVPKFHRLLGAVPAVD